MKSRDISNDDSCLEKSARWRCSLLFPSISFRTDFVLQTIPDWQERKGESRKSSCEKEKKVSNTTREISRIGPSIHHYHHHHQSRQPPECSRSFRRRDEKKWVGSQPPKGSRTSSIIGPRCTAELRTGQHPSVGRIKMGRRAMQTDATPQLHAWAQAERDKAEERRRKKGGEGRRKRKAKEVS